MGWGPNNAMFFSFPTKYNTVVGYAPVECSIDGEWTTCFAEDRMVKVYGPSGTIPTDQLFTVVIRNIVQPAASTT